MSSPAVKTLVAAGIDRLTIITEWSVFLAWSPDFLQPVTQPGFRFQTSPQHPTCTVFYGFLNVITGIKDLETNGEV